MPVGAQGHCGLVVETSFGAGGTVNAWQTITSESLNLTENNIYSDRIANTAEQVGGVQGNESVAGDIVFPVTKKMLTTWLRCGIGQETSPFYYERPLDSFMVQVDHETSALQASGCMIESLAFSSAQGDILSCTASIQAKGISKCTAGTPTYTSGDDPFVHQDATFYLNDISDSSVTAWNININNNLVNDLYGTNRNRIDIPAAKMTVTGSFTKLFDDVQERDAFLNCQIRSFKVHFARGSNYLTVWCPRVRYDTHTENIGGQSEYILETFNFTAYTDDPSTTKALRVSGDFS